MKSSSPGAAQNHLDSKAGFVIRLGRTVFARRAVEEVAEGRRAWVRRLPCSSAASGSSRPPASALFEPLRRAFCLCLR